MSWEVSSEVAARRSRSQEDGQEEAATQARGQARRRKPLPAQGQGGRKRTPTSAFDPAAGADLYEPEKI